MALIETDRSPQRLRGIQGNARAFPRAKLSLCPFQELLRHSCPLAVGQYSHPAQVSFFNACQPAGDCPNDRAIAIAHGHKDHHLLHPMLEGFRCKHSIQEALLAIAFAVGCKGRRQAIENTGSIGIYCAAYLESSSSGRAGSCSGTREHRRIDCLAVDQGAEDSWMVTASLVMNGFQFRNGNNKKNLS